MFCFRGDGDVQNIYYLGLQRHGEATHDHELPVTSVLPASAHKLELSV